jgi:hypothetical protein
MALADHVDIVITADSLSIARAGFGVPLIPGYSATFPERYREYTRLAEVDVDFEDDSPEYLAAEAMFAQSPRPSRILIGRGTLKPTLRYVIDAATPANSTLYEIDVEGEGVTAETADYTSDAAATQSEIHNGLVSALNAVVGKNYTAAFAALVNPDDVFTAAASNICTAVAHGLVTGDGPFQITTSAADQPDGLLLATNYWIIRLDDDTFSFATTLALALAGTAVDIIDAGTGVHTLVDTVSTVRPSDPFTVTGDAAGDWFGLEVNPNLLDIRMNHADPGIATDLAAILAVTTDFYWVYTLFNSEAYVAAAGAWCQSNRKVYVADSCDTRDLATATGSNGTGDVAATSARHYVSTDYHPSPQQFAAAGLIGNIAPRPIGSWTAKFKRRVGIDPVTLTPTQRANLVARHMNFYEPQSGVNITSNGTTTAGPSDVRGFIDNVVNLDWVESEMAARVFGTLAGAAKIPRDDAGMVLIENDMDAVLDEAVRRTIAKADPAPQTDIPLVSEMDDLLPRGVRTAFGFELAGAIHNASITGVVVL